MNVYIDAASFLSFFLRNNLSSVSTVACQETATEFEPAAPPFIFPQLPLILLRGAGCTLNIGEPAVPGTGRQQGVLGVTESPGLASEWSGEAARNASSSSHSPARLLINMTS